MKSKLNNKLGLGQLSDKVNQVISVENIIELGTALLKQFPEHPFKPYTESKMEQLKESIKENGILNPIIVMRSDVAGEFIIISGHNRVEAARQLNLLKVPTIIKDVDLETAAIMMVDTNFNQREEILASEKGFAYKLKLAALSRRAGRPKKNSSHSATNKRSDEILAESEGESKDTVRRYIRLTELIPQLLEKVDSGELGFISAVDLSYLLPEEQELLCSIMDLHHVKPNKAQAAELKKMSQSGNFSEQAAVALLCGKKQEKFGTWKIAASRFKEYLPASLQKTINAEKANEIFEEAMRDWNEKYKDKFKN